MKVAYLFPGQGAQESGMLHSLPEHPAVAATLAEAPVADDAASLRSTVTAQLALYLASVASARALSAQDAHPDAVAGHSVGGFAAAVVAGVLTFEEGLAAVRLRATMMERDFSLRYGMVAVLGLPLPALRRVVADISTNDDPLYVALINARDQIVVAGSGGGLDRVPAAVKAAGARDARRLDVNVLSHCPPLAPVASALRTQLAAIPRRTPRVPCYCDTTGRLTSNGAVVLDDLAAGVATTVQWDGAVPLLSELGTELFVQMPPGDTLARLAARDTSRHQVLALGGVALDDAVIRIRRVNDSAAADHDQAAQA
ncbi:MAG TPA: acyltransferase domain-containing protein [Solirubrobacteraceae bacterium]|jgi:malonate decarboxylase epsilon subunit